MLQRSSEGDNAHLLALKLHCRDPTLPLASSRICHESGKRMVTVKDALTQDVTTASRLNEQNTCIVAENLGYLKRSTVLVHHENWGNFNKKLVDQHKTGDFLQSANYFKIAECKQLQKELLTALSNSWLALFCQQDRRRLIIPSFKLANCKMFLETAKSRTTKSFAESNRKKLRIRCVMADKVLLALTNDWVMLTSIRLKPATVCGTGTPLSATELSMSPLQSANLIDIGEEMLPQAWLEFAAAILQKIAS